MDLYSILEVNKNATDNIIKKSYFRLAKKWHPDKNNSEDANRKFKEIVYAYEILSDPCERKKYDRMNDNDKMDFNVVLSQIISKYKDSFIIKYFYPNVDELTNDINNQDFSKLCNLMIDVLKQSNIIDVFNFFINKNIKNNILIEPSSESETHFLDIDDCKCYNDKIKETSLDINMKINVNLTDVYSKKKMTVSVKRNINGGYEVFKFRFPLNYKYIVFFNYGDKRFNEVGNLIFEINIVDDIKIDNFDIILNKIISIRELLNGGDFEIDFFGATWRINNFKPLKNNLRFVFENFGLPMSYEDEERGDLIVNFVIDETEITKYY